MGGEDVSWSAEQARPRKISYVSSESQYYIIKIISFYASK